MTDTRVSVGDRVSPKTNLPAGGNHRAFRETPFDAHGSARRRYTSPQGFIIMRRWLIAIAVFPVFYVLVLLNVAAVKWGGRVEESYD